MSNRLVQIVNKNLTSAEITDNNELKVSASISEGGIASGNVETPMTIEDVYVVTTNETGSTPAGVKSFSILFEGTGGALNGVPVVSGYENSKPASLGNALGSESYTIPTTADAAFPFSPRVVISYVIQL